MSREHLKKRLFKQASLQSMEEPLPTLENYSTVSSSGSESSLSTPRSSSSYGSVDPPTLLRQATLNSVTSRKGRRKSVRRPSLRPRKPSFRGYGTAKSPSETELPDPEMIRELQRQMSTRKVTLLSPRPKRSTDRRLHALLQMS